VVWIGYDGTVVNWFRYSILRNVITEVIYVTIIMRLEFHYSLLYLFKKFN